MTESGDGGGRIGLRIVHVSGARRTVDPQIQIAVLAHDTSTLPAGAWR